MSTAIFSFSENAYLGVFFFTFYVSFLGVIIAR